MGRLSNIIKRTRELLHLEEQSEPAPKPPPKPPPPKPKPKPPPKPPPKPKPAAHLEGIDYSFGSGITAAHIKGAGKSFVCRYLSEEGNPKNINKRETDNLLKAGLAVVLVWETTADRMLSGRAAGVSDAGQANAEATRLGMTGIPLYFAADFDATEENQTPINAYLGGAATIIGKSRTGFYGGYWPLKRAFDAKKITYGWQTYAWSGGKWDPRAQIQQYLNAQRLGPAEVDLDRSTAADFGQFPRP